MSEMSRKEAIGRIQEHRRIHSKKEPFTPYLDKAFDMAIEALQGNESLNLVKSVIETSELLRKPRPHGWWIPCSERLPEEEQKIYLVTIDYGDGLSCVAPRFFWDEKRLWNEAEEYITAWMPIPEPYKQEDEHGS